MKTIDTNKLLQLGKNGDWFGVDKMIRQHLTTTNYNIAAGSYHYNPNESEYQLSYDIQLNNAMSLNHGNAMSLNHDDALNTQEDKYDYLEYRIKEANKYEKL